MITLQFASQSAESLVRAAHGPEKSQVIVLVDGVVIPDAARGGAYRSNAPGNVVVAKPGSDLRARLRLCKAKAGQRVPVATARCQEGSGEDCGWLAFAYGLGYGAVPDAKRAIEFGKKACDSGHAASCATLAMAYYSGNGVPLDQAKAVQMWKDACGRGEEDGCFMFATIGIADNSGRALPLLEKSCDRGYGRSCGEVGARYKEGFGTLVDLARAKEAFDKACSAGFEQSCEELDRMRGAAAGEPGR